MQRLIAVQSFSLFHRFRFIPSHRSSVVSVFVVTRRVASRRALSRRRPGPRARRIHPSNPIGSRSGRLGRLRGRFVSSRPGPHRRVVTRQRETRHVTARHVPRRRLDRSPRSVGHRDTPACVGTVPTRGRSDTSRSRGMNMKMKLTDRRRRARERRRRRVGRQRDGRGRDETDARGGGEVEDDDADARVVIVVVASASWREASSIDGVWWSTARS